MDLLVTNSLVSIRKKRKVLFYTVWLGINFIQAATTQLFDDEAYYWMYARFLDIGYFDHPPMIAWLIRAGFAFCKNELGVRLLLVLLNTATIYLTQQLLEKKNDLLFYAIAGTVAIAQIGGIMAAPDIPLLFFIALFFVRYQRFVQNTTTANALWLSVAMAGMLYSKYHGVLIILCTLFSNLRLFRSRQAYLAVAAGILLYLPHLYWQYTHQFISAQFHLFERNAPHYRPSFTLEYIGGQLLFAGPLLGWWLLYLAARYKTVSLTERALKFSFAGIYLFFLALTFKGRVEANWTTPALIPLMVLSHQYLYDKKQLAAWLYKLLPATLLLVFSVRLYMSLDNPVLFKKDEVHRNEVWVNAVQEAAAGLPVVFTNSYQKAAKYSFYANRPALSLNLITYRRNNFNFWPLEDSLIGRTVWIAGSSDSLVFTKQVPGLINTGSTIAAPYYSFSRVMIQNKVVPTVQQAHLRGVIKISTPAHYLPIFQQLPYDTASVWFALKHEGKNRCFNTGIKVRDITDTDQLFTLQVPMPLAPGSYVGRFAISTCLPGNPSLNSGSFSIKVQ